MLQIPIAQGPDAIRTADPENPETKTAAPGHYGVGPYGEVLAYRAGDEPDDVGGAADPALWLQGRDRHERAGQAQEATEASGRTTAISRKLFIRSENWRDFQLVSEFRS